MSKRRRESSRESSPRESPGPKEMVTQLVELVLNWYPEGQLHFVPVVEFPVSTALVTQLVHIVLAPPVQVLQPA